MRSRLEPRSACLAAPWIAVLLGCEPSPSVAPDLPPETIEIPPSDLLPKEAFAGIGDPVVRSAAQFLEATRVLLHPRCLNCHPAGDTPLQGDFGFVHEPPVVRGPEDRGVVGMTCDGCHQDDNVPLANVPGAPNWHLAPISMAWVGKSPAEICEQLKDPLRNGGKSLAEIVEHAESDELVAWGWAPGRGRSKAPGDQKRFGDLLRAWVEDGATCPTDGEHP